MHWISRPSPQRLLIPSSPRKLAALPTPICFRARNREENISLAYCARVEGTTLDSNPWQQCGEIPHAECRMELRSPSSSNATDKGENAKQAACLNCRRSKTRCLRDEGDLKCRKCAQSQAAECIVPEYRVGRKKGIKKYISVTLP